MAQGVTSSFTEDVSFTSKFEMTKNDDILNIIGVTVTMQNPAGDLFTNEGNDVVLIEDSSLVLDGVNLKFYLGSGNDTLTIKNSTISASIATGSGNDVVFVDGSAASTICQGNELSFGTGDDLLELIDMLHNSGTIDFGTSGTGKLRFNGGSLIGEGIVNGTTDLDVTVSGGTLGCNLVLSGEETTITMNGRLFSESDDNTISISESQTTLLVDNNISTNVGIILNNANLLKEGEGIISFNVNEKKIYSGQTNKRALYLDKSDISIHKVQMNSNYVGRNYFGNAHAFGGAVFQSSGTMSMTEASLTSNFASAYAYGRYNYAATATGGAMVLSGGTMVLTSASFVDNSATAFAYSCSAYASGGAIIQHGGTMTLTSVSFSNNGAITNNFCGHAAGGALLQSGGTTNLTSVSFLSNFIKTENVVTGCDFGGAICLHDGFMTLSNALFMGNTINYDVFNGEGSGGAIYQSGGTMTLTSASFYSNQARKGGAICFSSATVNIEDTTFVGNSGRYGGAIYGDGGTLNYSVTSGHDLLNTENAGFLYLGRQTTAIFTIEQNAKLSIGWDAPEKKENYYNDSIASTDKDKTATIYKKGSGLLVINTSIENYIGSWIISDGTVELSYSFTSTGVQAGRNILFDDWMIESGGRLVLNAQDDEVKMEKDILLDGILDVGDGNDLIITNGNNLSNGLILFSNLTFTGNRSTISHISTTIQNRSMTEGCSFTLNWIALDSDYIGTEFEDEIIINSGCTINGLIDMAGGINSIHVNGSLNMNNAIKIQKGGETSVYAYYGSTIIDNTLTIYEDAEVARDVITFDWSDQTDVDKVRILVSTDSSFETFDFNLELYNQVKSFTLNLQQGYFIQFQAQDEDGWKQRLLSDVVAPNQVTGVSISGSMLIWDETHDNLGGNGVKQYHVEVASDASFSTILQSGIVTTPKFALDSNNEGLLYVRVRAEDYTDNIGAWSETFSGVFDNTPPSIPGDGNAAINGYSATLNWSAATDNGSGVSYYEYRVATDSTFGQLVTSGTTEACSVTVENLKYGTYYWQVRATDVYGNIGEWSLSKSFVPVDAIAPGAPTNLDFSIENEVSLSVIWGAASDDSLGSGLNGYEIQLANDSTFSNVVKTVSVTATEAMIENLSNATYYMRVCAVDNAGNKSSWTETKSFIIDKDRTAPTVTNVTADITTPTSGSVTVTATFSDDKAVASSLYKLGKNGTWTDYPVNGVIATDNTTIYFKAIDTSGNESAEVSCVIDNIDTEKPTVSNITPNTLAPAQSVTITAQFNDNVAVKTKQFKIGNGNWTDYTTGVTVTENTTVYFKAVDTAGNESAEASITITNIDRTAPVITLTGDTETSLQKATLSAVTDDGSAIYYRIGDVGGWSAYTETITVTANATYNFKATDAAGNTGIKQITFNNIDTTKPVITLTGDTETPLPKAMLSAETDDGSSIQYSMDNVNWTAYEGQITIAENGTYYFKATDAAGNTGTASIVFNNIDPSIATIVSGLILNNRYAYVSSNEIYSDTTVNSGACLNVLSGGIASSTRINNRGAIYVSSGGVANNTIVNSGGKGYILEEAIANNTIVNSSGYLSVSSGGLTDNTTINYIGCLDVFSGGKANNTTIFSSGKCQVQSGGSVDNTIVSSAGLLHISSGGVANNTLVLNWGYLEVSSGGVADNTTVSGGNGYLEVFGHAVAHGATIEAGGKMFVDAKWMGVAKGHDIKVNSAGLLVVVAQGVANNVTVATNGSMYLSQGGTLTGQLSIAEGAVVSAISGTFIDFNISDIAPDAVERINDLSRITGWKGVIYSLTVSDSQTNGIYALANGATGFDKTITVKNANGTELGTLTVGGSTYISNVKYSLELSEDNLSMVIGDIVQPTVSNIQVSSTILTNQNVTVTADFADDEGLASSLYRIGENGTWTDYPVNGVIVTENTTVYFKAIDTSGNESAEVSCVIDNIDTEKPTVSNITPNTLAPAQSVTITAQFNDNVAVKTKQFKIGNGNWTDYTTDVTVTENTTVYFKAVDTAGNESAEASITITNIDRTAPVITLTGDTETSLQKVTLTAEVDDVSDIYYSTDEVVWTKYTGEITVTVNAIYKFKATDTAGNTGINQITFNNIDTVAPVITLTGDTETSLQKATLSAVTDDGSAIYYRIGDVGGWSAYTETITVTANATYNFKATDAAGNTGIKQITFNNIDTTKPVITLTGDTETPLQKATLIAETDDGSSIQYSMDNVNWTAYEGQITIAENGTYYFKATDAAGNTGTEQIVFANIDTTKPVITLTGDNQTPLQSSTLSATVDDGSVIYYSLDNTNWTEYTSSISVASNATCYFKATDAAGNVGVEQITFANIDTTSPSRPSGGKSTINGYSVTLSWSAASDTGSGIAEYEYRIATDNSYEQIVKSGTNENCSITIDNLSYGSYAWSVRAMDTAGNVSNWSLSKNFATVDTVAPGIPANLDYEIENETSLIAIWDEVLDDELGSGLRGYDIQLAGDSAFSNIVKTISVDLAETIIENLSNGTYYFRVCSVDNAGNKSDWTEKESFSIDVDTTAPIITLTGDNETPLQSSILKASTDDGSKIYYSTDEATWTQYVDQIVVTANATYYFKSTDAAGNTGTKQITFANIDTVAPVITLTGDTETPLQQVTLTAEVDDGSDILYSTDNTSWTAYTGAITISENATYYFKSSDAAGNTSAKQITFDNIDTEKPTVSNITPNTLAPAQSVTITAQFNDNVAVKTKQFKIGNGNWTDYTTGVTVTEDTTVYFKAVDTAGNESTEASITITNIDRTAPVITLTGDTETPLQQVTLTAEVDDGSDILYSTDNTSWTAYTGAITISENATYYFKSTDAAGNTSTKQITFENIDTTAPVISLAGDNQTPLQQATLTAEVDDGSDIYYSMDNVNWTAYTGAITVTTNATYYFKATDAAGNTGLAERVFTNIDTTGPAIKLMGDIVTPLQSSTLTASAEEGVEILYSTDNETWKKYEQPIAVTENAIYYFKATDAAGNVGMNSIEFTNIDTTKPVISLTGDNQTPLQQTTLTATVDDGSPIYYRIGDSGEWTEYKEPITVTDNVTYNFLSTDAAGNEGTNFLTFANIIQAPISDVVPQTQTWEKTEDATQYIVEYSTDNFEHVIQLVVDSNSLDSFQMPAGKYQMRVKADGGNEWTVAAPVDAEEANDEPKLIKSNADGHADVFFVNTVGTWESGYVAQHVGSKEDVWGGTKEFVTLFGKNKLTDIIEGSTTDANVLLMSDDTNGDALFVDDIYSASPDDLGLSQSRIAQIDEIRAGAGNDIVDMTSNRFEYTGDGLTIRGGEGNDTIWANKGDNFLFGDAGKDRIVGASGNDVIVGGIGNDRMHGGGGNDIFTFCDNWGVDEVEQLAGGSVTLWFTSEMEGKVAWDDVSKSYTDGVNQVSVKGVTSVELKFGDDGSSQYASLVSAGAFAEFTSQKIFEESNGLLAGQ